VYGYPTPSKVTENEGAEKLLWVQQIDHSQKTRT